MSNTFNLGRVKGRSRTINGLPSVTLQGSENINVNDTPEGITISITGLEETKDLVNRKVSKSGSKRLTTNEFTSDHKRKIESIQEFANRIEITSGYNNPDNPVQNKTFTESINSIKPELNNKMDKVNGKVGQILTYNERNELIADDLVDMRGFTLSELKLVSPPNKTTYFYNERFDPNGLIVHAVYENGSEVDLYNFNIEPMELVKGTTKVTISFSDGKITKSLDIPLNMKRIVVKRPITQYEFVETGYEITPEWLNVDTDHVTVMGKLSATEPGDYSVRFVINDPYLYEFADGSASIDIFWRITPYPNIYGFEIDLYRINPEDMISYIGLNKIKNYRPARMDYDNNRFDYGDWENVWFIKKLRPVMMGYDGSIKYELNKNNYKEKATGGASDVTNTGYSGNVMVGIPTVWIKVDTSDQRRPKFYFADNQVDSDYKAWAHMNSSGVVKDYTYIAAYDGYMNNGRLRSISGQFPTGDTTMDSQRRYCQANGTNYDMATFSDRNLISLLLLLIGKNTNTSSVFGRGNVTNFNRTGSEYNQNSIIKSGTLDDKGLFYGYNKGVKAVKVFGIENFWGNIEKRVLGLILDNQVLKYKLTKGTHDGSTVSDYSTSSVNGYLIGNTIDYGATFYINNIHIASTALLPAYDKKRLNSPNSYFCDHCVNGPPDVDGRLFFVTFGGFSRCNEAGTFYCSTSTPNFSTSWYTGTSLSYKSN